MDKNTAVYLNGISNDEWNEALRRANTIRPLALLGDSRTRLDVVNAAQELGLGLTQTYNLLKRYLASPKTSSLIPHKRGCPQGTKKIPEEAEKLLDEIIENEYLVPERPALGTFMDTIKLHFRNAGLEAPSEATVKRRINDKDSRKVTKKRHGSNKAEQKFDPVGNPQEVTAPLQEVQADHTLVDLIIVDSETREPIARPWITLIIDIYTRLILGFFLSLEHPSIASLAVAFTHAIFPKERWLRERNLEFQWPARGIPKTLYVDNAKEFKSGAFKYACDDYGIDLRRRPVRRPKCHGAHIERLIGTQMGAVHLLPGTTFSNVVEKGEYNSEKNAAMTFEEAELWIACEILGKYHNKPHSTTALPPIWMWNEYFNPGIDYHLNELDQDRLFIDFLPQTTRTVTREGITLNKIPYWDGILTQWVGANERKFITKYYPPNMSRIYLKDHKNNYWPIGYKNLMRPPVSLWEIKYANNKLREKGQSVVDEDAIFRAIEMQREIVKQAIKSKKSARRYHERVRLAGKQEYVPEPHESDTKSDVYEDKNQHTPIIIPQKFNVEDW